MLNSECNYVHYSLQNDIYYFWIDVGWCCADGWTIWTIDDQVTKIRIQTYQVITFVYMPLHESISTPFFVLWPACHTKKNENNNSIACTQDNDIHTSCIFNRTQQNLKRDTVRFYRCRDSFLVQEQFWRIFLLHLNE